MTLALPTERITQVLLPDGWHTATDVTVGRVAIEYHDDTERYIAHSDTYVTFCDADMSRRIYVPAGLALLAEPDS